MVDYNCTSEIARIFMFSVELTGVCHFNNKEFLMCTGRKVWSVYFYIGQSLLVCVKCNILIYRV